jgi:hypothetical protein
LIVLSPHAAKRERRRENQHDKKSPRCVAGQFPG